MCDHLLVEICLPLQYGIEVISTVRAFFGPDHRHADDVAQNLFQRLAMLFIHGKQKERQHHDHHAHGRRAGPHRPFEQKEQRHADERPAAEADQLPLVKLNATWF